MAQKQRQKSQSQPPALPMRPSWLVQRLMAPLGGAARGKLTGMAFGGGVRNGGLSEEALSLLAPLMSFDYMGAAEYEWGAVPKALQKMARAELVSSATINVKGQPPIYLVSAAAHKEEAQARVTQWATGGGDDGLRDPTRLRATLRAMEAGEDVTRRPIGWLELDNGFFFAVDEAMWVGVCQLYGITIEEKVTA